MHNCEMISLFNQFISEGYESLPFTEAYFKVENREEQDFVVNYLFEKGYRHFGGMRVDISNHPAYIFVRFEDKNISYVDNDTDEGMAEYVRDYNRYEMDCINPKLFRYKDILQLDFIEKTGNLQVIPSYKPRKIDRTLEGKDNKYNFDVHESYYFNKYNTFVAIFSVDMDKGEFHKIITMLDEMFDNCLSSHGSHMMDLMSRENNEGQDYYYIVFTYRNNRWYSGYCYLSYLQDDDAHNIHRSYPRPYYYYDLDDLNKFISIIRTGTIPPSYKPRKIDRTLESVQEEYLPFRVWCDNYDKSLAFEDFMCDELGWIWDSNDINDRIVRDDQTSGDTNMFCNFNKLYKTFDSYGDYNDGGYIVYNYPEDLDKFKNRFLNKPSYAPRRITKTYEGFTDKQDEEINVLIQSHQHNEKLQRELFARGYSWYENVRTVRDMEIGNVLTFYPDGKEIVWSHDVEEHNKFIKSNWRKSSKIYLSSEVIEPSYKPRKIDRTLESFDVKKYSYDSAAFKVNDKSDVIKIITFFHDKHEIEKYHDLDIIIKEVCDVLGGDYYSRCLIVSFKTNDFFLLSLGNFSGYNIDPTIYTINDLGKFGLAPSYQPRKIERTLEAYSSPTDISKSNYFTEYNTLVFSIKKEDNYEDVVSFLGKLETIFRAGLDNSVIRHIMNEVIMEDQYTRVTIERYGGFDWGYSRLVTFPSYAKRENLTYKRVFTFNEIINNLDIILKYGDIVPSYAPRKIDRTLEAYKYYPYRFKTEQEFIDAFGENWRYDIRERGPNWADGEMDHLFGKDFPFDESEMNSRNEEYPINGRWDDPNSSQEWMIGWDMLILNKPRVPSYQPRKIDRTLEAYSNECFYNRCVFKIMNESESIMVQNYLFDNGYTWNSTWVEGYNKFKCYPQIIWVYFVEKKMANSIYTNDSPYTSERVHKYIAEENEEYGEFYVNPKIFNAKDILQLDYIKRTGMCGPSYRPRKIDRTMESSLMESYKDYAYNSIVIRIDTIDDVRKSKKYLGKYAYYNQIASSMMDKLRQYDRSLYFRINMYDKDEKDWTLTQGTIQYLLSISDSDTDITYEKIFTIKDLENGLLDNFIKFGKILFNPSYEPRKMDRTLEKQEWYPYRMKTEEEMVRDFGPGWRMEIRCGWNTEMIGILGKDFPKKDIDISELQPDEYLEAEFPGVGRWTVMPSMMVRNKPSVPSYEPRRIYKTLESDKGYPYFLIKFRIKSEQELADIITLFYNEHRIGRGDYDNVSEVISHFIRKLVLGKMLFIIDLEYRDFHMIFEDMLSKFDPTSRTNPPWVEDLNNPEITDPNIYEYSNLRLINGMIKGQYWDSLSNLIKPSYAPRKIDKGI